MEPLTLKEFPTTIIPSEPQTIEIKLQYHEGPYSLHIEPIFNVSPKEAIPFVEIEVDPVESVYRNSIVRMVGTITVDPNIPSEKIFLNIIYNGTTRFDSLQPFKSSWVNTAIIDIEKNLIPEPEQDIPVYENCGPGTTLQGGICVVNETNEDSS